MSELVHSEPILDIYWSKPVKISKNPVFLRPIAAHIVVSDYAYTSENCEETCSARPIFSWAFVSAVVRGGIHHHPSNVYPPAAH